MRRPIPDDVRRFVLANVASVPFLEAMLLLRAHSSTSWSGAELVKRLYVNPSRGAELVNQLIEYGFGVPGEGGRTCRWNGDTDLASMVDKLADIYAENVVGVTELIHSSQERRAHQFADAFRLRRKDE